MSKRVSIILILITAVLSGIIAVYFLFLQDIEIIQEPENKCISDYQKADYEIRNEIGKEGIAFIKVSNQTQNIISDSFEIKNVRVNYRPIEIHKCGVYAVRMFSYDSNRTEQYQGYKEELWKYDFAGKGDLLILLAEKPKEFISYYSPDFRVSPTESYIILEKGYLGKDDYSLVIKSLKTKEDIFTLPSKDLQRMNSNFIGVFDMLKWSEDGQYFWGSVSDGAYVNGYFRIDTQNWKTDIYEAPDGAMGGSPLNINTGYLPIQPGQIWTGDYQLTQELKEQYKKEGKKSQLYLYNLFTKEKTLVETTDEPLFWFKPRWLSDTQLEYKLSNGEKKVYEVIVK